jgi:hypothetical protein
MRKLAEMKKNYELMIQDIVKGINWSRIRFFHQAFDIKWQFEEKDGYIVEKVPTIADLKDELRILLRYVILKDLETFDYGNWVIYWHSEERAKNTELGIARLEALFTIEDSISVETRGVDPLDIEKLKNNLDEAIKEERYEDAAKFRDKLVRIEKGTKKNREEGS